MESNEERQQLEEIKVQLRRADRAPMRTSSVRKETFTRLIELAHSPYSSLKSVAATNIKSFVKDFPELEDEALNAVYDLCEDPVPKVRIEGYQAIIQVSKEQKKWVKRNADVLVQLLQSDEPDEVLVVKKALTEHLDMDPVVTLTVLCDQIVPMDDPMDEEEQSIRDRLRALVLAFISGEAKRGIVERHANVRGSPAEEVLVTSLLKGLTKSTADIDIIVGDILLALPSFSRFSPRGKELLDVLLAEAKASLKVDLPHDDSRSSISQTRAFLDLAHLVAVDKQVAHPSQLLQFFLANFVSKITLARLTEDLQVFVLSNVAETFSACEARGSITSEFTSGSLSSLRNQVVVACPSWLSCFLDIKSDEKRPWKACATLLRACSRRNAESKATTQSNLTSIIVKIQGLAEKEQDTPKAMDKSSVGEVHNLSRSLLQNVEATKPPSTPKLPSASPAPKVSDGNDSKGPQQQQQQSRQTNASVSNGNRPITPSAPRADRQRQAQVQQQQRISPPNRLQATGLPRTKSVEMAPPSKVVSPAINATATTSTKTNGDNGSTPSLLSRLAGGRAPLPSIPTATAVSQTSTSIPAKRRAEPDPTPSKTVTPRRPSDVDLDPVGGWSIKGAASRAASATSTKEGNAQGSGRSTSLLDRMKGDDGFGDGSERRGKKRTRKT